MVRIIYASGNAYDMLVCDDGNVDKRYILTDEKMPEMYDKTPREIVDGVEDWSGWEQYDESLEELIMGFDVLHMEIRLW